MEKKITLKNNEIRFTNSTAVENDLSYFVSTLAEINEVVSQTYGPDAGYVAQHMVVGEEDVFEYTKDGLTTLNNMVFNDPTDNLVLSMVKALAQRIKQSSGDGSTTASKLLYYMVKHALEKTYAQDPLKVKSIRVNTPRAMEIIIKKFIEELARFTHTEPTIDDLRFAGKIALNSDETLMEPIDKILDHLRSTNAKIDSSLRIDALRSFTDETTVNINPGYLLGATEFVIDNNLKELENAKLILMPANISLGMIYNIIGGITHYLKSIGEGSTNISKVIFLINQVENDRTRTELRNALKKAQSEGIHIAYDFLELSNTYRITDHRLQDLQYLLNLNVIELAEFIELRDDDPRTNYIYKWVKKGNDESYGFNEFTSKLDIELRDGFFTNIKFLPQLGFTASQSELAIKTQITEEYKKMYDAHIASLTEASKVNDESVSSDAKARLFYLQDNYHVVNIAKRIGDKDRLFTAYKDATKAMTSVAAHGYYMGGSVGAYVTMVSLYSKLFGSNYSSALQETITFLHQNILDSIESVMQDLKLDFNNLSAKEIIQQRCDYKEFMIDGQVVIIPVETDRVMIPNVLYLFSNIFASLMVEFQSPVSSTRFKMVSKQVNSTIDKLLEENEDTDEDNGEAEVAIAEAVEHTPEYDNTQPLPENDEEESIIVDELPSLDDEEDFDEDDFDETVDMNLDELYDDELDKNLDELEDDEYENYNDYEEDDDDLYSLERLNTLAHPFEFEDRMEDETDDNTEISDNRDDSIDDMGTMGDSVVQVEDDPNDDQIDSVESLSSLVKQADNDHGTVIKLQEPELDATEQGNISIDENDTPEMRKRKLQQMMDAELGIQRKTDTRTLEEIQAQEMLHMPFSKDWVVQK